MKHKLYCMLADFFGMLYDYFADLALYEKDKQRRKEAVRRRHYEPDDSISKYMHEEIIRASREMK